MATNEIALKESEKAQRSDLRNPKVPECLYWTIENCADFIESLGFPQYRECIIFNKIDGRRLIWLDASHLPSIGITDFKHMLKITKEIRDLLRVETPDWKRSISMPARDNLGLYLEAKSFVGEKSSSLSYEKFEKDTQDANWQPPLTNQGFILPSF